jgi:hypothetical protein
MCSVRYLDLSQKSLQHLQCKSYGLLEIVSRNWLVTPAYTIARGLSELTVLRPTMEPLEGAGSIREELPAVIVR